MVLGILFGNLGGGIAEPKCFGIDSVIFLCVMVPWGRSKNAWEFTTFREQTSLKRAASQKGGFCECALVPVFCSEGTCERTLVTVFVLGEHLPKPPFWKPPFANRREGSIPILQGGPGSVRFGYGLGMERFERFRFSVAAVPLRRGLLCVAVQFNREDGSGSGFGSWKTVPAVPVPRSVPGKTVPTVPVSGSGSVPGPP